MKFGYEDLEVWISGSEYSNLETNGKEIAAMIMGLIKSLKRS